VHGWRIFHHDQFGRTHFEAEFPDGFGAIGEQAPFECGIGPGARDDQRPHRGRNGIAEFYRLTNFDRGYDPFLNQQLFERQTEHLIIGMDFFIFGRGRVRMGLAFFTVMVGVILHIALPQILLSQCS